MRGLDGRFIPGEEGRGGDPTFSISNKPMPQQDIFAQATLALCSHSEIHPQQQEPSWHPSMLVAQVQLLQPHMRLATPAITTRSQGAQSMRPLVTGTVLPSEFAGQNRVQLLPAAAPKSHPCPAPRWRAASRAWAHSRARRGSGEVTTRHRVGNGVLALGHTVRAPAVRLQVAAGAKIWVPSSLQSGSAVSLPGRAAHPQPFGCRFALAANSANSKLHSHLWKGARIAKIRLANVFLEVRIPMQS